MSVLCQRPSGAVARVRVGGHAVAKAFKITAQLLTVAAPYIFPSDWSRYFHRAF